MLDNDMAINGLIGRKLGMTQIFISEGELIPVTVVEVKPSVVVQVKTGEKDGYEAVQLGYGATKESRVSKALQGHFRRAGKGACRKLAEVRTDLTDVSAGQVVGADIFRVGEFVDVTGTTKGKGFAGVVKRHGFRGGRATHGSMFHRAPGSIGASAEPSRVFKGQRLPGHMGNARHTVQNLKVVAVRPERNLLLLMGAVPGGKNGYLLIRQAKKKGGTRA
jgi:large subunit ribosomal protein L3